MPTAKTIVVTGASSGIGFELARRLYDDGHRVIGCSRTYPKQPYDFEYMICDLKQESSMVDFSKAFSKQHDHLDVLINCAGMGVAGAIEETSYQQALKTHQINVLGPFMLTQLLLPLLRNASRPKVIMIGSVAGVISIPFQAFYSMSKASLASLTESLRLELKPFGVDVSNVMPGDTKTDFTVHRQTNVLTDSPYKARVERSIKRMEHDERHGKDPITVVNVVRKLMRKKRMKAHVVVGFKYKVIVWLAKRLPMRWRERVVYKLYGK